MISTRSASVRRVGPLLILLMLLGCDSSNPPSESHSQSPQRTQQRLEAQRKAKEDAAGKPAATPDTGAGI
jgi:hypothetical protein